MPAGSASELHGHRVHRGARRARRRDGRGQLAKLLPETATRISGEAEEVVPISALRVGDRVRVRPGERVPADGTEVARMADAPA